MCFWSSLFSADVQTNCGANDDRMVKELLEIWRNITQFKYVFAPGELVFSIMIIRKHHNCYIGSATRSWTSGNRNCSWNTDTLSSRTSSTRACLAVVSTPAASMAIVVWYACLTLKFSIFCAQDWTKAHRTWPPRVQSSTRCWRSSRSGLLCVISMRPTWAVQPARRTTRAWMEAALVVHELPAAIVRSNRRWVLYSSGWFTFLFICMRL